MSELDNNNEIVGEFLVESHENLDRLDRELVVLEKEPGERSVLASIFRTIHTIKGTAGFLGFTKLESLTHAGENLLSRLRDGELSALDDGDRSGLYRSSDSEPAGAAPEPLKGPTSCSFWRRLPGSVGRRWPASGNWIASGRLRSIRPGRRRLVRREDLDRFLAAGETGAELTRPAEEC
jgi:HPt (histidine-containing phosphotransfer) domain-containing protein